MSNRLNIPPIHEAGAIVAAGKVVPKTNPRYSEVLGVVAYFLAMESPARAEEGRPCWVDHLTQRGQVYYRILTRHENTHSAVS